MVVIQGVGKRREEKQQKGGNFIKTQNTQATDCLLMLRISVPGWAPEAAPLRVPHCIM